MRLISTELNQQLASALRYSVSADRFYISGKAGFWRLIGVGLLMCATGVAVGLGFYGYSHLTRNTDSANIFASTFAKALAEVQLRAVAEGTVHLEPSEVSLAKDQTISLDPSSRLLLDQAAKVRADGEIQVQTPSVSPLDTTTTTRRAARTPTITNFTVFKEVDFDKGQVVTGWKFLTSAQKVPTNQYCYYTEKLEASLLQPVVYIGLNEELDPPKQLPQGFDITAAFKKCVWFRREGS